MSISASAIQDQSKKNNDMCEALGETAFEMRKSS